MCFGSFESLLVHLGVLLVHLGLFRFMWVYVGSFKFNFGSDGVLMFLCFLVVSSPFWFI